MVRIKLARVGKNKQGSFRVIVTDRRRDTSGTNLGIVGTYNPRLNPKVVSLDKEKILSWIAKGAQVTDSLHNLFVSEGIISGKRMKVNRTVKNTKAPSVPEPVVAQVAPVETPAV